MIDSVSQDSTKPRPAGKPTRRGSHTRKQILDASLHLFSERGFARTTVRDIARQAGITDAAIYYHFESKRDLLEALVEERGFISGLLEWEQEAVGLPVWEALLQMALGAVDGMDDSREFLRLIIMEGLSGDEAAVEQYGKLATMWEQGLAAVLKRYAEVGALRCDDPQVVSRQIIYSIVMAFIDSLLRPDAYPQDPPERRREALAHFVRAALERTLRDMIQG